MQNVRTPRLPVSRFWRTLVNPGPRSIRGQRLFLESMARLLGKTPKKAQCRRCRLGGVTAEEITGWAHEDGRTLLYLHGGAYMMGSIRTHRPLASIVSRLARARGVIIGYRLAPEHPHPAALEDALAAYRALLDQGTDPARMAVAGDSAGGGLTLALLLALRDAGDPLPAAAYCMSPWTDLTQWKKSVEFERTGQPCRTDLYLRYVARLYAAGADTAHPYVSPALGDYTGLPPLLIQAAREEALRDDAARVAQKAREAGVPVTLNLYAGSTHVLPALGGINDQGRGLLREAAGFLKTHMEKGNPAPEGSGE
ncbi:MAG: alpha/beta hydrolase [Proteobacteria bacterium]|nr:alpha/beta hydrolase [Pseudomonadota bacterium]